ncbi:hypothetical protein RAE21_07375 [Rhodoferax sp. TBRC 17198]|uniref:hypothetical protein n=1 Tax=Rhodoferax potami TaxID=3068338 RepID=UPI0028BE1464|nr:hypothetical protein [Rhodoferax sp. TBRC 17198]MDT7522231.1 hypothetical protein [Rhodoferax sp. TBRC 17198]
MRINKWALSAVVALGLLGACGGGGSSVDPLTQNAPGADILAGVEVNTAVVISETQRLIATSTDDTSEPAALGSVTLATSDTDEPADI